jgi:hypothetical protein
MKSRVAGPGNKSPDTASIKSIPQITITKAPVRESIMSGWSFKSYVAKTPYQHKLDQRWEWSVVIGQ